MAKLITYTLSSLLCLVALSCGDQPSAQVERATLCARLTEALCAGNVDCCDQPERQEADMASCEEHNLDLSERTIGAIAASPGVSYDSVAAALLVAAVEQSAQQCSAVPDLGVAGLYHRPGAPTDRGLALVLRGTLSEGLACGGDNPPDVACTAPLVCRREVHSMPSGLGGLSGLGGVLGAGECAAPPAQPALGEACSSFGANRCGEGVCASCAFFRGMPGCPAELGLSEGRCVVAGGPGDACDFRTCASGLYCDGRFGPEPGVCSPTREDGESCESAAECAAGSCEGGRCAPTPPERSHCAVWRRRVG